jgi:DNA invertase Pin-like site-specific DNA recombinase
VDKPDRIFRTSRDLENTLHHMEVHGATLCIIDFLGAVVDQKTWAGKHMLRTMVSFAEFEGYLKSQRMKDSYAVRRTQGKATPKIRFGCERTMDGLIHMPQSTVDRAQRAYARYCQTRHINELRETLEQELCQEEGVPYRKSAFHQYHISRESAFMMVQYGYLLARGVEPQQIACMSKEALKQATVGL